MDETPTPHDAYVAVETGADKAVFIRTPSGGLEWFRPGKPAIMPLRQALDALAKAPKSHKLTIARQANPLDPTADVGPYVPGSTLDNDPRRDVDRLGFPRLEGVEYAEGTL